MATDKQEKQPMPGRLLEGTELYRVADFVRDGLGCGCPDDCLRSIRVSSDAVAGSGAPFKRAVVGDRLLIYVLDRTRHGALSELARVGLTERNERHYNRFRLIMQGPVEEADAAAAQGRFASVAGTDAKAHLHFIEARALPAALQPEQALRPVASDV
jgi:hypothetical protein